MSHASAQPSGTPGPTPESLQKDHSPGGKGAEELFD